MFFGFGGVFIIFGVISLDRIFTMGPLEDFRIGNVPIPSWQGASASNVSVFIFCLVGLLTVVIAIVLRYLHHRKNLEYLRSKGIYDGDGDGKVDSFEDRWLDDL
jgi:hypothetical protein